jgi:VanZ family protein
MFEVIWYIKKVVMQTMSKQKSMRWFWWSLFAAWALLTFFLSAQSGDGSSSLSHNLAIWLWRAMRVVFGDSVTHIKFIAFHRVFRKVTHFVVHMVLAFLLVRASCWTFSSRKTALWFSWVLAIFIAIIDEAIQIVAPGRVSMLYDAGLNLSGTVLGAFISSLIGPKNLNK